MLDSTKLTLSFVTAALLGAAGCGADAGFFDGALGGGDTGEGAEGPSDGETDDSDGTGATGTGDGDGDDTGEPSGDGDGDSLDCPLDCGAGTCVAIDGVPFCECPEGTAWAPDGCGPCPSVEPEGAQLSLPVVRFDGQILVNGAPPPKSEYDDANLWLENSTTGDRVLLGNSHDGSFAVRVTPGIYEVVYEVETPGAVMPHNPRIGLGKIALFAPMTRDVDVPAVTLGGPILLDGAPPPASEYDDGNLFFRQGPGDAELLAANTHDGDYVVTLVPGRYEIVYRVETPGPLTPRNDGAIIDTREILTDIEVLPIEMLSAPVSGAFTINGVTAPASEYDDANIELESATAGVVALGNTHDQAYALRVLPGSYALVYRHETGANVPANVRARFTTLEVPDGGTTQDIDIPMVELSGAFRINGAPAPASEYDDGIVALFGVDSDDLLLLGNTHEQTYAVKLLPGSYDVVYGLQTSGGTVPDNKRARIVAGLVVQGSGVVDVDIPAVPISGTFTVNGGAPPDSIYEDGRVYLRNLASDDSVLLGNTSAGSYAARVVPGDYALTYTRETGGEQVPSNENATLGPISVQAAGIFDVDIPVVAMSGQVTLAGDPAPMSPDDGGQLYLRAPGGDSVLLGDSFAPSLTATLVAGTYGVYYRSEASVTMPQNDNGRFACITVE